MRFECRIFDEPLLEFGDQHSHQDPRLGLTDAGPLQAPLGDKIRLGVVGDAKTVQGTKEFFLTAAGGFASKAESHPNMNLTSRGFTITIRSAVVSRLMMMPVARSPRRKSIGS